MKSSKIAINVENISKCYRLWLNKNNLHENLAIEMLSFLKSPLANYRKYKSLYCFDDLEEIEKGEQQNDLDVLWALKDISFDVEQGQVLGIVGRNGAGKSTLLKILSRVTDPTSGQAFIKGRISSLLEVGTGFHPELSGRENIYLNGTVLGMRKREVDSKFDEIVDFAGVETFLDTPVKRYSSGMKVRLAFSVAAHLEPEILIIDEVLAVGDAAFQKKCLDKMQNVGQQGRTVLFVSHNLPAVTRLCDRAILIQQGRLVKDGLPSDIISYYLSSESGTNAEVEWGDIRSAPTGPVARLRAVRVRDYSGNVSDAIDFDKDFTIEMEYEALSSGHILMASISLCNDQGDTIFATHDHDHESEWNLRPRTKGIYLSTVTIPGNLLAEGMVFVNVYLHTLNPNVMQFMELSTVAFNVIATLEGNFARGNWPRKLVGMIRPLLDWHTQYTPRQAE